MPEYVPVSFSALPLASSVSPSDQTLVVQAGVAKRAPFSALPTAPAGPPGPPGPPGSQIITGSSPPTSALGNSGDIYIQINTGDVYKKTGNTWNLIGNIKGPPGEPGQQGPAGQPGRSPEILFGVGEPQNSIGNNGDLYINTNTGELFSKVNNNWVFRIILKGERGTQIYSSNTSPSQYIGLEGDYYINTTNGNLFKKQEGDWTLIYNLGSTGSSGSSGGTVYFTENRPHDSEGNNGDIAIAVGPAYPSGLIYQKQSGTWNNPGRAQIMTRHNKLVRWGLVTSENARWVFDQIRHEIFDLDPYYSNYHITFSNDYRFYYEILGWNNTLRIQINKRGNTHFTLYYRTLSNTITIDSRDSTGGITGLRFNISLGMGDRIIAYNANLNYYTNQIYIIQSSRPNTSGISYNWIYGQGDDNDNDENGWNGNEDDENGWNGNGDDEE
jgi:hypothetical protein